MQGSIYSTTNTYSSFFSSSSSTSSFTASTSFSSSGSTPMKKTTTKDSGTEMTMSQRPSFLISPFTKKTDIQWTTKEDDLDKEEEGTTTEEEMISSSPSFDSYTMDSAPLTRKPSNKKRKIHEQTPMTRNNLPLPPLPPATTVENFWTILNGAPGSPNSSTSSYFSARSFSSSVASSSSSTLDSILLDDVADNLTRTHIEDDEVEQEEKVETYHSLEPAPAPITTITAPIPPPKDNHYNNTDHMMHHQRNLMNPSQDHNTSKINNKQEKRSNSLNGNSTTITRTSLIINSSAVAAAEMKISTSEIPTHHHTYSPNTIVTPPKSANVNKSYRPPIPPRTSSMPLPPPPKNASSPPPPLPADAKRKASAPVTNKRPSTAKSIVEHSNSGDSTWTHLLGHKEVRAKLGRSLNTSSTSNSNNKNASSGNKKLLALNNNSDISSSTNDGGKLLKVTENGQVVLLFEMMDGKLQPIAGTQEKLFERLADETAQDMDYVDTYLMNHVEFTSSMDLLNFLINRFHLEPSPGEYEYFVKWQFSIQTK